jgi:hypothetical protein
MPEETAEAAAAVSAPAAAEPTEPDPAANDARAEGIAAIIRNGLSNGPIAQSQATWDHLQTRLGEIARAILKEL